MASREEQTTPLFTVRGSRSKHISRGIWSAAALSRRFSFPDGAGRDSSTISMSSRAATPTSTSISPSTTIVLYAGSTWDSAGFVVAAVTNKPKQGRVFSVSRPISGWQNVPRPPSAATE
ncbi:hypothetical protein E2C01_100424 [Portunus trituberculatus]|uniref:Uncharacterized protein n=1 Tax=Portunus trituberculatus TaxID=210409 RepID=A0A5B7KHX9_PORTR|nr:hypothetical protein [Portunus trituberculatus]